MRLHSYRYSRNRTCFNSRTREGCDGQVEELPHVCDEVSIHAPGRGATLDRIYDEYEIWFQFTHPGGVRRSAPYQILLSIRFQFTHPGGVRPSNVCPASIPLWFQFTHPGGVRLAHRVGVLSGIAVSIHAPGRGATASGALRWKVRRGFNSRTREGCDSVVQSCVLWGG